MGTQLSRVTRSSVLQYVTNLMYLSVCLLRCAVMQKLRPATSRQVARKVQQESLKYEKYGTSFSCEITVTLTSTVYTFFKNLVLHDVIVLRCIFNAMSILV